MTRGADEAQPDCPRYGIGRDWLLPRDSASRKPASPAAINLGFHIGAQHRAGRLLSRAAAFALACALATPGIAQDKDGYLGEARCATCHRLEQENWAHTVHAKAFQSNTRSELAARGCEACHGPGAKHLENATDKNAIVAFTRRRDTPVETQNAQCL